jgi:hypothetical protein
VTVAAASQIEKTYSEPGSSTMQVVEPWYPPPTYPPPRVTTSGSTDGRAVASLITAIAGILLGLPIGIPGMVLGTVAYFLARSSVSRIDSSQGRLGGRGVAVAGWVLGVVAMAIGSAVTLVWVVVLLVATAQPSDGG